MFSPPIADQRTFLELRRRGGSKHLHSLGARVLDEWLAELGRDFGIEADIVERLERYRRLTPEMVYVAGGDRFPPLFAVLRGGRR